MKYGLVFGTAMLNLVTEMCVFLRIFCISFHTKQTSWSSGLMLVLHKKLKVGERQIGFETKTKHCLEPFPALLA